eukprot:CAMPEP_0174821556 /NCGR_PEP_ID=MMETSP1107-20130205/9061_1 /TAXON_ID=36770 /ORGANISM="Paraphysomonas vestita, Strain GFlagA" /LENGTH=60 /DNA_ID=CAMNT_0016038733 /DNA_START=428 /DNA_END=610 /DNA_ORIENTATION=+
MTMTTTTIIKNMIMTMNTMTMIIKMNHHNFSDHHQDMVQQLKIILNFIIMIMQVLLNQVM